MDVRTSNKVTEVKISIASEVYVARSTVWKLPLIADVL